ncbi:Pre-ATP-grasp domain-containing protein, partial [Baffinella frigidus]
MRLAASLCVLATLGIAASANIPLRDSALNLRSTAFVPGAPSVLSRLGSKSFVCKGRACNAPRAAVFRAPLLRSVPTMVAAPERADVLVDDAVSRFVKSRGGNLPIRKILIANNGMAATKSILSMRQWAYMQLGDERAIKFVAMATPEDLNANAEFVRLADSFVEVPGGKNSNNYANVDLIVRTAMEQGVDAVWPGWGHASENPRLPNTLRDNGIKFIGPTGPVMAVLGDKIAANILAQTAKVPSIPWSGSFGGPDDGPLVAELNAEGVVLEEMLKKAMVTTGVIPEEIFKKAMVTTVDEACVSAERIGYPVMLKASEGGGGKGIRMSDNEAELRNNFVQVGNEVQNEVPGSPMFMMQLCKNARHLEVQIVGDEHGNA